MIYSRYLNSAFFANQATLLSYRDSHRRLIKHVYESDIPECTHPVFLKNQSRYVPCGHCPLCARRAKRDWELRCNLELQEKRCGEFMTLTFNEDTVCDTSYRRVQLFLKRLRKVYKNISYFCAFEHGDKLGRPHYHLLIFGLRRPCGITPTRWNDILAARFWQYGFVTSYVMSQDNIPYVVGYVSKKLTGQLELPSGITRREFTHHSVHRANDFSFSLAVNSVEHRPTFYKMSKGLGFGWLSHLKRVKVVIKKGFFTFGKKRFRIPRALLLKFQALGLDWAIPEAFFDGYLKKVEAFSQKQPRFSDTMSLSDILKAPILEVKDLLFQYIERKVALCRQRAKNLTKLRI